MPGVSGIQWDVFDRMTQATVNGSTTNYKYDAFGRRVAQQTPNGTNFYFYDMAGRLLASYPWINGYQPVRTVYFAGQRVGQYKDRVGSVRNTNGGISSHYYPFGEEITSTANDRYKFAETFRDADTGLDYALNRYYASSIGRFLSTDRGAADFTLAQSFNRYAYVRNDPANGSDPTGLILAAPDPADPYGGGDYCAAALGQDWYWFNFNMTFPNPCIGPVGPEPAEPPPFPFGVSVTVCRLHSVFARPRGSTPGQGQPGGTCWYLYDCEDGWHGISSVTMEDIWKANGYCVNCPPRLQSRVWLVYVFGIGIKVREEILPNPTS
jgi:RHS repeat-associated protein